MDTLCGYGYRQSLHAVTNEGGMYCQLAEARHALTVCQQLHERELADARSERDKAHDDLTACQQARDEAERKAFRAGFIAHPEPETDVFTWSFDPEQWSLAADREPSAWEAYKSARSEEPR